MIHQAIPEQITPRQFATYNEALASLPREAEWSSSFGNAGEENCSVYFRVGSRRWSVSRRDPIYDAWVVRDV